MALFLGLYLGHVLGDFVFQPGRLVLAKRRRPSAVLLHTGIVLACTALVLVRALPEAALPVLAAGVAHLAVEQVTVRARREPRFSGLTLFMADQALHLVSLGAIAAIAPPVSPAIAIRPVSMAVLASVSAVLTVAFAGSILVLEIESLRRDRDRVPDPILRLDLARMYGIAERGGALITALLVPAAPVLGAVFFAPRIALASFGRPERRAHHRAAGSAGLALCAVAWILLATLGHAR